MKDSVKARVSWDPKVGFRVPLGPFKNYSFINCVTSVNDKQVTASFILMLRSECFFFNMFSNIRQSITSVIEPTSVFEILNV